MDGCLLEMTNSGSRDCRDKCNVDEVMDVTLEDQKCICECMNDYVRAIYIAEIKLVDLVIIVLCGMSYCIGLRLPLVGHASSRTLGLLLVRGRRICVCKSHHLPANSSLLILFLPRVRGQT